jgi:hypothetical protein
MKCQRTLCVTVLAGLLGAVAQAQSPKSKTTPKDAPKAAGAPSLTSAHGLVVKAESESLTIRPRGSDGRFEKEVVLQVTGTSKVTQLTIQNRAGKQVAVQREADVKSLQPQQAVAVIYTAADGSPVLLSAVVLPAGS